MKRLLLWAATALLCMNTFAQTQGDDNGFGIKLFAGFGGDKYGLSTEEIDMLDETESDDLYKKVTTFGLSLDNRWYVANPGRFGIAVNARWLDCSFGRRKYEAEFSILSAESKTQYIDFGLLGVGPMGTFYLNNDMAIDLYYNIQANASVFKGSVDASIDLSLDDIFLSDDDDDYFISWEDEDDSDDSSVNAAFGVAHFIGADFRFRKFQVGVEYKIANLKGTDWGDDDVSYTKFRQNQLRVFLGLKF